MTASARLMELMVRTAIAGSADRGATERRRSTTATAYTRRIRCVGAYVFHGLHRHVQGCTCRRAPTCVCWGWNQVQMSSDCNRWTWFVECATRLNNISICIRVFTVWRLRTNSSVCSKQRATKICFRHDSGNWNLPAWTTKVRAIYDVEPNPNIIEPNIKRTCYAILHGQKRAHESYVEGLLLKYKRITHNKHYI